ncbi:alpha/beta fold hydrolase [Bacillaceae bacterium SIJ1]|uniref:alpha/beta fold hydrolase n=1 Tax=Litoribacterium kuwaitense TaxID=1398745 RepID=UPI0013E9ED13|nr:alpha/beta fold hydrolase [Litoribacterium kuwaitense]NGP45635.1 alpha/beta fold hydrolase [Litoribacterium kuwaitense]
MANIFMTGATGFIGYEVLQELLKGDHTIYALVRSLREFDVLKGKLPSGRGQVLPVIGDLQKEALGINDLGMLRDVDTIIHAGGPMDIGMDMQTAKTSFLHGANEMMKVSDDLVQHGSLRHFIHVVGYKSPFNEDNWREGQQQWTEENFLPLEEPYERMKFLADLVVRQRAEKLRLLLSVVNPSTVIGDKRTGETEQTSGLGMLVEGVRKKQMLFVPGGHAYRLPLVTKTDLALLIAHLVTTQPANSDTYYVLASKAHSPNNQELISSIAKELRTLQPIGKLSIRFLERLVNAGIGNKLGIPKGSLNFFVNEEFSTASVQRFRAEPFAVKDILPYVIADIDFRLSHPNHHSPLQRNRRGKLATIENILPDAKQTVLLIHGLFSSADMWTPIIKDMPHVNSIAVDLPGFGRSPYHHQQDALQGMVDAIIEIIQELNTPVTLIGHSIGGFIAARVHEKMPHHIKRLILLQPTLQKAANKTPYYQSPGLLALGLGFMKDKQIKNVLVKQHSFKNTADIPEEYVQFVRQDLQSSRMRKTTAEMIALLHQTKTFAKGVQLDKDKTSIIWGEFDQTYSIEGFRDQANVTLLPLFHSFPISQPKETAARLKDFI